MDIVKVIKAGNSDAVTLPKRVKRKLKIKRGDNVAWDLKGKYARLRKVLPLK